MADMVRVGWDRQLRLWLAGLLGSRYDGLHHFQVVEPGVLMRCGQPRVRDLEEIRARHGLASIVCARGGTRHPLRGRWFRVQRKFCERHGIRLHHMPFSDRAGVGTHLFEQFLQLVSDPGNHPMLVHCEQGFHRTGVLVAAYRIRQQGWPLERAEEEMANRGFELRREKRVGLLEALRTWAREIPAAGAGWAAEAASTAPSRPAKT